MPFSPQYFISRTISLLYPTNCLATHLNMDNGTRPRLLSNPLLYLRHTLLPSTANERAGLARTSWFMDQGSGYRSQQSTKPQTLSYAFADSPVSLLAWIYEKLHDWTDNYPWTDDEVCTWMSIYWFSTAGPGANVRIYYEATHQWDDPASRVTRERTTQFIPHVKIGLSHSPRELRVLPSTWTRTQGNVVYERTWKSGGHFFAWEKPEHLLTDVRAMFGRGGGAYGIVKGREGYVKARL
jgi:hypothetical protein